MVEVTDPVAPYHDVAILRTYRGLSQMAIPAIWRHGWMPSTSQRRPLSSSRMRNRVLHRNHGRGGGTEWPSDSVRGGPAL